MRDYDGSLHTLSALERERVNRLYWSRYLHKRRDIPGELKGQTFRWHWGRP